MMGDVCLRDAEGLFYVLQIERVKRRGKKKREMKIEDDWDIQMQVW